jgi:uncharacterized protein YbjQ (UPF0145 family)
MSRIFITTGEIKEEKEVVDFVIAEGVEGIRVVTDNFARIRSFFGGRVKGYQDFLRKLRGEVIQELTAEAKSRGANAIEGFQVKYESINLQGDPMLLVACYGTAVKVRSLESQYPLLARVEARGPKTMEPGGFIPKPMEPEGFTPKTAKAGSTAEEA